MIKVYVTHQAKIPYNAAIVNAPCTNVRDALDYAYRWTQNIDGSWSNKIGSDANINVDVCHYKNSGMGLRSSMVGDEFAIEDGDTYVCAPFGFEKKETI
jgi:hypothetical protein